MPRCVDPVNRSCNFNLYSNIFDSFGMTILASMIFPLLVSSMKNAISSVLQFGQASAVAWPDWFHLSIQFEWKIWLQWVWIRSPTAIRFRIQGWIQIEQSIRKTILLGWRTKCISEANACSQLYMNVSSSKMFVSDSLDMLFFTRGWAYVKQQLLHIKDVTTLHLLEFHDSCFD